MSGSRVIVGSVFDKLESSERFWGILMLVVLVGGLGIAGCVEVAEAGSQRPQEVRASWQRGLASSYGPGLYGNRTACGQTLTTATRGVAHKTLRCGTRLRICHRGRCTHARVIDRGPYSGNRVLDLTAATTRELCRCSPWAWGERSVRYRKAPLPGRQV